MKMYITLILSFIVYAAHAHSGIRLELGKSFTIPSSGAELTLESFKRYEPNCAVPGFNCGSGYNPNPFTMPIIKVVDGPKCQKYPLGEECETTFEVTKTDNKTYVELKLISVFAGCEKHSNLDNRNSCLIGAVKNHYDKPAFRAENCERIKDAPERKDACYEAVADKAQDVKICDLMKGQQGFQCVLLRAKVNRDPEICRTLKKNRFHHTEQDLKDQIQACLNTTPKR
jgi:hypothetical protein